MKNPLKILAIVLTLFLTTNSFADIPPSVTINVYQAPTAVKAFDKAYLLYELYITSYMPTPITLTSLEAKDGLKSFMFPAEELAKSILTMKPDNQDKPAVFQPSEAKIVYMWLPFENLAQVPSSLTQEFRFSGKSGESYKLPYASLAVNKKPPVIIGAPLSGTNWVAVNGLSNSSSHRRAAIYLGGRPYYSERYAIDFLQEDKEGSTFKGDKHKNSSYYCYNQDLLAVAKGKVVLVNDGIPENVPNSDQLAQPVSAETIAGNTIVLDIGNGAFAIYAHIIPGSMKVKVGDLVSKGQVLAKLGNSGNSSEPHLHFSLVDKPSVLEANSIPYGFEQFKVLPGKSQSEPRSYLNQLPLDNALISFE